MLGVDTGEIVDGIGVEAELQYVTWLCVEPGQLRIDWLIANAAVWSLHPFQKIGNAAYAFVDEGHLVDDVVALCHGVAHPLDPSVEGLFVRFRRHWVDGLAVVLVLLQAFFLMKLAFELEQPGERAECGIRFIELAVVYPAAQRQVVRAVEPSCDLGRCDETFGQDGPLYRFAEILRVADVKCGYRVGVKRFLRPAPPAPTPTFRDRPAA